MTSAEFQRYVEAALASIPLRFREALANIAIVVEREPSPDQLEATGVAPPDTLLGLYEGTPLIAYAADQVPYPNKITLFRRYG